MLRNKLVIAWAGGLLLIAGATGARAQAGSGGSEVTAAGRLAGARAASSAVFSGTVRSNVRTASRRTAAPARFKTNPKDKATVAGPRASDQDEQECPRPTTAG